MPTEIEDVKRVVEKHDNWIFVLILAVTLQFAFSLLDGYDIRQLQQSVKVLQEQVQHK